MDNTPQGAHTGGQDDAPLTPEEEREEERVFRKVFGDPHLFADLVDDLELSPPVYMLMWWGAAHGVYPSRAIPKDWPPASLSEEELWAWRRRWQETRRERRQQGHP